MSQTPESSVQGLVHNLEQGPLAPIVRRTLFVVILIAIAAIYVIYRFRGLEHGMGMDQAQIARELARGHGFVTQTIRPLAVAQLAEHHRGIQASNFPDTYHAPLNPWLESFPIHFVDHGWDVEAKNQELIYAGDTLVALLSIFFFLCAVWLNYFTAKQLFDKRVAVLGAGLTVVCDLFWKYSISGLPQMLMLLIFSGIIHVLLRALVAQERGRPTGFLLAGVGALFGLLALAHGLTIWILIGALLFVGLAFRPRGISAITVLCVFGLIYSPWVIRNEKVSGTPFGIAPYSQFGDVKQSEAAWMRQGTTTLGIGYTWFRTKMTSELISQSGRLFALFGASIAPVFFLSLLHPYKRRETWLLQWGLLSMWFFAFFGMAISGLEKEAIAVNQLHILFVPFMILYALTFLIILWNRLEIDFQYARAAFITVIFLISGVQLILTLLPRGNIVRLVWPPYAPPIMAAMGKWMEPNEIIVSDMPYAVAWYADRKSLWLPATVADFNTYNDFNQLGAPLRGLYLTPVTSRLGLFPDIVKGEYKEWGGFVLRNPAVLEKFPLKSVVPLPIDGEAVFYSDRERWNKK